VDPTSTRPTVRISPEVNERLRLFAALEGRQLGETADRVLDEHLPSRAELAERISKGAEQK
jgi:hypothetical protein